MKRFAIISIMAILLVHSMAAADYYKTQALNFYPQRGAGMSFSKDKIGSSGILPENRNSLEFTLSNYTYITEPFYFNYVVFDPRPNVSIILSGEALTAENANALAWSDISGTELSTVNSFEVFNSGASGISTPKRDSIPLQLKVDGEIDDVGQYQYLGAIKAEYFVE